MSGNSLTKAAASYFTLGMSNGGSASSAAKSYFVGGSVGGGAAAATDSLIPKIPDITLPTPSAPTALPTFNSTDQMAAQKKTLAALQLRQGRASTILTQGGDSSSRKLGGGG